MADGFLSLRGLRHVAKKAYFQTIVLKMFLEDKKGFRARTIKLGDLLVLGSVTMFEGSDGGPTPQRLEARTLNW